MGCLVDRTAITKLLETVDFMVWRLVTAED